MVEEGRETIGDGGQADQASDSPASVASSSSDRLSSDSASPGNVSSDGAASGSAVSGNVDLKGLIEFLARNLVTKPDDVAVEETLGEGTAVLELRVDKEDLGRVIGKQGRTAKSLRTILNAAASRSNTKATLEIVED